MRIVNCMVIFNCMGINHAANQPHVLFLNSKIGTQTFRCRRCLACTYEKVCHVAAEQARTLGSAKGSNTYSAVSTEVFRIVLGPMSGRDDIQGPFLVEWRPSVLEPARAKLNRNLLHYPCNSTILAWSSRVPQCIPCRASLGHGVGSPIMIALHCSSRRDGLHLQLQLQRCMIGFDGSSKVSCKVKPARHYCKRHAVQ